MNKKPTIRKIILYILLGLLLLILGIQAVMKADVAHGKSDFKIAYRLGTYALQGNNIYGNGIGGCRHQYYPPTFSLFIMPFAMLPIQVAKGLWYILDIICIVIILLLGKRMLYGKNDVPPYFFLFQFFLLPGF